MEANETEHPVPITLADRLRGINVGASYFFSRAEHSPVSVRSTLTRVKKGDTDRQYTSREDADGVRVWRLA